MDEASVTGKRISRRNVVGAGVGAIVGTSLVGSARAAGVPLRAVVTIDGRSFEHREESGRDLGNFVSTIGNFTQRCVRADAADSPLTVFFRPDLAGDRTEVVFELGGVFAQPHPNLGAYTASIFRGEQLLATVDVPANYNLSRWRWQSAPRPVVGNIDQLIAQGLLPPYDRSAARVVAQPETSAGQPPAEPIPNAPTAPTPIAAAPAANDRGVPDDTQGMLDQIRAMFAGGFWFLSAGDRRPGLLESAAIGTAVGVLAAKAFQANSADGAETTGVAVAPPGDAYTVMGLAGVTAYMPQTGERNDIGLLTEPQARYICTGANDALASVFAQAEASGTVPWHMRDVETNAPLNFRTYPAATWYGDPRAGDPVISVPPSPITPDTAHMPDLAYVPYVLTGDPYYLEELQFSTTWAWGSMPAAYRPGIPQSRAFAWFLRNLAQAARITPASVPSWLLPQTYWRNLLEDNRVYLESNFVNDPNPLRAVFRSTGDLDNGRDEGASAPGGTWVDPWQEEFVAAVLGWIVSMGFSEWRTAFDWKIGSTLARTGLTSGWARADATPYRMVLRASRTSPTVRSWADAWTLTQQAQGLLSLLDLEDWRDSDMTYLAYSRGALAFAANLGAVGAADNLNWATGQLNRKGWKTAYKWRLGGGLAT